MRIVKLNDVTMPSGEEYNIGTIDGKLMCWKADGPDGAFDPNDSRFWGRDGIEMEALGAEARKIHQEALTGAAYRAVEEYVRRSPDVIGANTLDRIGALKRALEILRYQEISKLPAGAKADGISRSA